MDIEDIAKLDFFLRSNNGKDVIIDIDSLIIVENDINAVTKLKEAAYRLNEINTIASDEIKETWQNLFSKQVRFSVTRAKNKKPQNQ